MVFNKGCDLLYEKKRILKETIDLIYQMYEKFKNIEIQKNNYQIIEGLERIINWNKNLIQIQRKNNLENILILYGIETIPNQIMYTICDLPLLSSGNYDTMPKEVLIAALGRIIHLLLVLSKDFLFIFPYIMKYKGSYSTIGGVPLFTEKDQLNEGIIMLQENVKSFCLHEGMKLNNIKQKDLIGNLVRLNSFLSIK